VKGERRSPVLRDQIGRADPRLGDEGVEIARVVFEAIRDVGLARLAEADEIDRDAMRDLRDVRDDVAPDVGGTGIAVQKERDRGRPAAPPRDRPSANRARAVLAG
jgi:hypothetical protein